MANEQQAYNSQQANNEEQSIDIKKLIFTVLNNWFLFVIFAFVALVIGSQPMSTRQQARCSSRIRVAILTLPPL